MRVDRIWRHPVKSFVGERVASVDVGALGIAGDRHWAVRDHERGGIRGAKKIGELMRFSATYLDDGSRHVLVTFPDGSTASTRGCAMRRICISMLISTIRSCRARSPGSASKAARFLR